MHLRVKPKTYTLVVVVLGVKPQQSLKSMLAYEVSGCGDVGYDCLNGWGLGFRVNVGALIIRSRFWGVPYGHYSITDPKTVF